MRALQAQQCRAALEHHKQNMQQYQCEHLQKRITQLESILDSLFTAHHSVVSQLDKLGASPYPAYTPRPHISRPFNSETSQRRLLRKGGPLIDMSKVRTGGSFVDQDSAGAKLQTMETNWQVQRDYTAGLQAEVAEKTMRLKSTDTLLERLQQDISTAHLRERDRWARFLGNFKSNCERELMRRQAEVVRLHSLLSTWIHRFMELQEQVGIPSGQGHRRRLSAKYEAELRDLCNKTGTQASSLNSALERVQAYASDTPWQPEKPSIPRATLPNCSAGDSPVSS